MSSSAFLATEEHAPTRVMQPEHTESPRTSVTQEEPRAMSAGAGACFARAHSRTTIASAVPQQPRAHTHTRAQDTPRRRQMQFHPLSFKCSKRTDAERHEKYPQPRQVQQQGTGDAAGCRARTHTVTPSLQCRCA